MRLRNRRGNTIWGQLRQLEQLRYQLLSQFKYFRPLQEIYRSYDRLGITELYESSTMTLEPCRSLRKQVMHATILERRERLERRSLWSPPWCAGFDQLIMHWKAVNQASSKLTGSYFARASCMRGTFPLCKPLGK